MAANSLSARLRRRKNECTFASEKIKTDMSKLSNIENRKIYIPILATTLLGVVLIIFGIVLLVS